MSQTVLDIPANKIDGAPSSLREFAGHVILVVNVASACGLTPQYEALEKLYESQRGRGLVVVGFPSNDFGAQEPGSNEEIAQFCSTKFGVQFPMFEKIAVKGEEQHPLYATLIAAQPAAQEKPGSDFRQRLADFGAPKPEKPEDILWNFEKFLIDRSGNVVARFAPDIPPDDPIVLEAIEAELAKPA
jgi:glutathione peroxidase